MNKNLFIVIIGIIVAVGAGSWAISQRTKNQPTASPVPTISPTASRTTSASPQISSTPVQPTPTASGEASFTMDEVAQHNNQTSCWSVVSGIVYDLTTWIPKHPGGPERILSICGKDGTAAFSTQHAGAPKPQTMLASFRIGKLK